MPSRTNSRAVLMRHSKFIRHTIHFALFALIASCGDRVSHLTSDSDRDSASVSKFCVQTFNAYGPAYAPPVEPRTREWGREMELAPCAIIQSQELWSLSHYDLAKDAMGRSLPHLSSFRFDDVERPFAGKSGLALFTDHLIEHRAFEAFSVNQDGLFDTVRGMLGVIKGMGTTRLQLRGDSSRVTLINLHTHPSSNVIRTAQIAQLARKLSDLMPLQTPLILSGDFNFAPGSPEYLFLRHVLLLEDSYAVANHGYSGRECTYCEDNPHHWGGGDRVIDFIFSRSGGNQKLSANRSLINLFGHNGIVPSDHYGLRAEFSLSQGTDGPVSGDLFQRRKAKALIALEQALRILRSEPRMREELATFVDFLAMTHAHISAENQHDRLFLNLLNP